MAIMRPARVAATAPTSGLPAGDAQPELRGGLFVDFENVFYVLTNEPYHLLYGEALSATIDLISELRHKLFNDGFTLIVERCYADWEKIPHEAQRQLQISGVLPRFVDSRTGKSSADIELSLDLLQQLLTRGEIEYFVLVGGDRDYLPVLRRIKEQHRAIRVCAFKTSLSGDVRDFVNNYRHADIIELDELIDPAQYKEKAVIVAPPAARPQPAAPGQAVPTQARPAAYAPARPAAREYAAESFDADADYEREERYLKEMFRFMEDKKYNEVHLGPFFRWLRDNKAFEYLSTQEQRKVFDRLCRLGVLRVEERDSGSGFTWSAVVINYNHPLTQRVTE